MSCRRNQEDGWMPVAQDNMRLNYWFAVIAILGVLPVPGVP